MADYKDINVGDQVPSRNEHTGEQGYNLVTRLFRGHTDRVVYLRIAKASSVQRGRSERRRSSGSRKEGSSSDGEDGSGSGEDPDSQQIRCTPEHPFWVRGRGWVAAGELREGDPLVGSQGEQLVVVDREVREEEADHYNFEVEDWHTYFVSETDQDWAVWTHNRCEPPEVPQNIGNMVGVDFVDPIFGNLSRKEFSALRKRVKEEYGVTLGSTLGRLSARATTWLLALAAVR